MNNNKSNFIGTIKVDINLYDANNNEFSIEIINDNNDHLINRINNDLKILDMIRNNNRIKMYEDIIKENQELIQESVTRKKQDILDVAKYMISKEKEILYYKQQIEELNNSSNKIENSIEDTDNIGIAKNYANNPANDNKLNTAENNLGVEEIIYNDNISQNNTKNNTQNNTQNNINNLINSIIKNKIDKNYTINKIN
jgi:hypothetical protein